MKKPKKMTKRLAMLLTTAMLLGNGLFPQNVLAYENASETNNTVSVIETEETELETKVQETEAKETEFETKVQETEAQETELEDIHAVAATSLGAAPMSVEGSRAITGGYSGTITATLQNVEVGYIYYDETEVNSLASKQIQPYNGSVTINNFYKLGEEATGCNGRIIFYARAKDGYLLTGLNASGAGNVYALDTTHFGPMENNFPNSAVWAQKGRDAGYQVCFGYARFKGGNDGNDGNFNANFTLIASAPKISVTATADKTEGVIKGDKLKITVKITPETTLNGKTLSIESVSVKSATLNGTNLNVKNIQKVSEGVYQGTADYTVTENDCAQSHLEIKVTADTNYSYRLGVYDSVGNAGGVTTTAYAENSDTSTIQIAPRRAYSYKYEMVKPDSVTVDNTIFPAVPQDGSVQVGEDITLANKPANVVDTRNNGIWEFDGWYMDGQKVTTDKITQTNSDKEFTGKWHFVDLSAEAEDVTYDGNEHGLTNKQVNGTTNPNDWTYTYSDSENGTYTATEPKFTDAGEHTIYIKATNKAGDEIKTSATVKIAKKDLKVTTTGAEKDYDGKPLKNSEIKVEGLADKDKTLVNPKTTGEQTATGSSKNTYDLNWNDVKLANNYKIEEDLGDLTVHGVTIDVSEDNGRFTWNKPEDVIYNGQDQKWVPEIIDKTTGQPLVEGVDYEVSYDKDDFTNVGDPIGVTITGKGHYEGEIETSYSIKPVQVTLTADSAEKVYDGTPLEKKTYTVTEGAFVKGEGVESVIFEGAQTQVGTSENKIKENSITFKDGTKAANYAITLAAGLLKVTDGTAKDPVDANKVVVKTHDDAQKIFKLGDVITYTIKVTNIYGVEKTITITEQAGVTLTGAARFENVKPGETITTTASYTVTEADVLAGNIFTNKVKVSFDDGKEFENTDDAEIEAPKTDIQIIKTAQEGTYKVGDKVKYTIRVVNKGNVTVSGIKLNDTLTKDKWTIKTIKPGEEFVFTAEYTIKAEDAKRGYVKNTVIAEGFDSKGESVNVNGEATVKVEKQLDAPKTGDSAALAMCFIMMFVCGSIMIFTGTYKVALEALKKRRNR